MNPKAGSNPAGPTLENVHQLCHLIWPGARQIVLRPLKPRMLGVDVLLDTIYPHRGLVTQWQKFVLRMVGLLEDPFELQYTCAVQDFMQDKYSIPVPQRHCVDHTTNNPINRRYIVTREVGGFRLSEVYDRFTHEMKVSIAKQLGTIWRKLFARPFNRGGYLEIDHPEDLVPPPYGHLKRSWSYDKPYDVPQEPLQWIYALLSRRYRIDRHVYDTEAFDEDQFPIHRATTPWQQVREALFELCEKTPILDDMLANEAEGHNQFYLTNRRLTPDNIMVVFHVPSQQVMITGVLDWQDALFAPKVTGCEYPYWLWNFERWAQIHSLVNSNMGVVSPAQTELYDEVKRNQDWCHSTDSAPKDIVAAFLNQLINPAEDVTRITRAWKFPMDSRAAWYVRQFVNYALHAPINPNLRSPLDIQKLLFLCKCISRDTGGASRNLLTALRYFEDEQPMYQDDEYWESRGLKNPDAPDEDPRLVPQDDTFWDANPSAQSNAEHEEDQYDGAARSVSEWTIDPDDYSEYWEDWDEKHIVVPKKPYAEVARWAIDCIMANAGSDVTTTYADAARGLGPTIDLREVSDEAPNPENETDNADDDWPTTITEASNKASKATPEANEALKNSFGLPPSMVPTPLNTKPKSAQGQSGLVVGIEYTAGLDIAMGEADDAADADDAVNIDRNLPPGMRKTFADTGLENLQGHLAADGDGSNDDLADAGLKAFVLAYRLSRREGE